MEKRKLKYFLLLIEFFLVFVLEGIIFYSNNQKLKVIFFDIGQGDAILIEKGSTQIIIDGGPDGSKMMEKLGKFVPFWDRKIEVVFATHPDADHISGLVEVLENYEIGQLIDNSFESDSKVYKKYRETFQEKKISRLKGERGLEIKKEDMRMKIIYPATINNVASKDSNSGSLVIRLDFGENSFLFTGDFPIEKEELLLNQKEDIEADVLKVSHHGSAYASGEKFLEKVHPRDAIISVGKNNRYNHPAKEVLERLKKIGARIMRTDENGDIEYDCFRQKGCFLSLE